MADPDDPRHEKDSRRVRFLKPGEANLGLILLGGLAPEQVERFRQAQRQREAEELARRERQEPEA